MRVLLICGAGIVSGKEIMSLNLLSELKKRGHHCACVMSNWGSSDFRERLKRLEIEVVDVRIGFISKTLNWPSIRMTIIQSFYLPSLLFKFLGIRNRIKPDVIIHTNFHHIFLLYPVLPKQRNIYWSHEIIPNSSFYKKLFSFFADKVDFFVSVSDAVATSLKNLVPTTKVVTIKNGIHAPASLPAVKPSRQLTLAIVGQISRAKGHDILFEALKEFSRDSFKLKIVGEGDPEYVTHLKKLAEQSGFSASCDWVGYIKNTDQIYSDVDIAVVPSIFPDPYPTIVMEAGLRAIPVVASSIGGLAEMVKEGVNGFLCEPGNAALLSKAIRNVFDIEEFDHLKQQSLAFAIRHFNIQSFGDQFDQLVNKVKDR